MNIIHSLISKWHAKCANLIANAKKHCKTLSYMPIDSMNIMQYNYAMLNESKKLQKEKGK